VGVLGSSAPSFVAWTVLALPPAIIIAVILRFVILWRYPSNEAVIDLEKLQRVDHYDDSTTAFTAVPTVPSWKKSVVAFVFIATVLLWLTGPLHHIPTTVVSLLPVVIFTLVGIIDVEDIQSLRWDVILLIIGGLALGVGVSTTGLAAWFAGAFDLEGSSMLVVTLLFAYLVVIVSNFMSNTAATNVMLPIVVAFGVTIGEGGSQAMVIAVALSASFAMSLPVSTPPNAIVYASGRLASQDFLLIGLLTAVIGPPVVLGWLFLIS
jgi:sodium-dependent dicarboxylate transporter 2/3/5